MSKAAWLTIVGLGEDGLEGLTSASQNALTDAQTIWGAERHIRLLSKGSSEKYRVWPVPFKNGINEILKLRGQPVVVLASGDPFWYGAGTVLSRHLKPDEWTSIPSPSCFSLAASTLGWSLETTECYGLHAAPFSRLRQGLQCGQNLLVTVRDGATVGELATYLTGIGFGASTLHVLEALGGPRARCRKVLAKDFDFQDLYHPVVVGITAQGGPQLSLSAGKDDALFANDGQITKRPMRALTISALAPKAGELLWDIGGGSGSIAIEWLLCHPTTQAISIEKSEARAQRIDENSAAFGVERLRVITGSAPDCLEGLEKPDCVFIGGGLSEKLLQYLIGNLAKGTRIVCNAVTLESEALLAKSCYTLGGELLRIELSHAGALGKKHGWKAAYPVVQWRVTL